MSTYLTSSSSGCSCMNVEIVYASKFDVESHVKKYVCISSGYCYSLSLSLRISFAFELKMEYMYLYVYIFFVHSNSFEHNKCDAKLLFDNFQCKVYISNVANFLYQQIIANIRSPLFHSNRDYFMLLKRDQKNGRFSFMLTRFENSAFIQTYMHEWLGFYSIKNETIFDNIDVILDMQCIQLTQK